MPTTNMYGSPSAANEAIGGVPTLHYFDFMSRGRGQVVRLLWEDAGIAYKDVRYTFAEWPEAQRNEISKMNPTGSVPVVEINGRILTQSYAMLRHFSHQLNAYDGKTEEERYWADAICDIAIDWRTDFVRAFFSPNKDEDYAEHQRTDRKRYLNSTETHLKAHHLSRQGPYVIGNEITYADMVLYQIMHDESLTQDGRAGLKEYPRLTKLVDAVEARPNIKAFLGSDRYKG